MFDNTYDTGVTPAPWAFTVIWTIIFVWQALHIFYSLSLLFRKTSDGDYLYLKPSHICAVFYCLFMLNNSFITGWLFLYAHEQLIWSFVFLLLASSALFGCGYLICRTLNGAGAELILKGLKRDVWLTRILTINGIVLYGTWSTIATLINMYIVMHYAGGVEQYICNWVVLSIIAVFIVVWFVLETFVLDRHMRYIFTPYIILILAFSGIIDKFYESSSPESYLYMVVALLVLSLVLAVVKAVVIVLRERRNPILFNSFSENTDRETILP